jgi:hypothetical protein
MGSKGSKIHAPHRISSFEFRVLGFEFCVREPSEKRLIAAGNHTSLVARYSEPRFHSKPKTQNPKLKAQSAKHKTQN